ncbi:hypothetical protein [Aurantimonas coralicida]|uniref:hypothetical protein n=2 Tax=Aurantimonas coralicida TaxID=182270 RepID=UPI000462CB0C|nr:hypothetical protein [Aurantimonas coralicida]|tara:strand:+ start:1761 stop:2243 length:483 start_codon:yes stop_codon:yes gene_type:complete
MMRLEGLSVAALALAAALTCAAPANADDVTYRNERFGTTANFPAEAFPNQLPAPTNGDGLGWSSPAGAEIFIYARPREPGETPQAVVGQRADTDEVTYDRSGKRWAVVSGYRDGRIFYERYIFRGDLVHSVSIRYPESERATYDKLVGPITMTLDGPARD